MNHGSLRNFDLNLLIVLNAILQHRSVSAAAEELRMSQSSASHALTRLRRLLGDELFVKTRNRMMPTPRALELVKPVSELLQSAHEILVKGSSFHPFAFKQTITLALGDTGETLLLPPLLDHLRREAPNCNVQTVMNYSNEAEQLLLAGKLDVYVGFITSSSSNLMCQKLFEDDLVAICSQAYPRNGALSLEDYLQADHVTHQVRSQMKSFMDQFLERQGYERRARVTTPTSMATPDIIVGDPSLISVYPRSLAVHLVGKYPLKILELDFEKPVVQVFQYWHRRYNNEVFSSWLRKSVFDVSRRFAMPQFQASSIQRLGMPTT